MMISLLRLWASMIIGCALLAASGRAADVTPPIPARHFNDFAGVTTPQMAKRLNESLVGFQNITTNEVYVVVYPRMPSDTSVDDFCYRVTRAWHPGHEGLDNGVVFFVFVEERQVRIEVRPGLEGVLPDATCKKIIAEAVGPKLKVDDYDGGIYDGVAAIMDATQYEYDADEIIQREVEKSVNAWDGYDTFFLVADIAFALWFCYAGLRKIRPWLERSAAKAAPARAR